MINVRTKITANIIRSVVSSAATVPWNIVTPLIKKVIVMANMNAVTAEPKKFPKNASKKPFGYLFCCASGVSLVSSFFNSSVSSIFWLILSCKFFICSFFIRVVSAFSRLVASFSPQPAQCNSTIKSIGMFFFIRNWSVGFLDPAKKNRERRVKERLGFHPANDSGALLLIFPIEPYASHSLFGEHTLFDSSLPIFYPVSRFVV